VIFPFRSTFAIKYFQEAHALTRAAAGNLNGNVFLAAVVATPLFGFLVDRIGRHGALLALGAGLLPLSFLLLAAPSGALGLSTVLLGISFSLVPAVLWPAVARYVESNQLGTAYGLMTMLQNAGLALCNVAAGYINDVSGASAANPGGYSSMLWFFGLLSSSGFVFAALLWRADRTLPALRTV
jgi:MFS family permease